MPLPSYRFGPFVIDRVRYRVARGGEPVELSPKLFDLLLHLVDHRDTLVTKENLLDTLWADANVTENALAQAVSELRQSLDDDAQAPAYIKTVARRGYRFIAAVEEIDVVRAVRPIDPESGTRVGTETPSVAVIDFSNVTRDPSIDWLATGIAETVAGDLRALGRYRVIDRSLIVEAVRSTDGSLHQLASRLHAQLVVMGSFQHGGDRIRITARLVDVQRGEALADAKIDGPPSSIFELQDAIVGQLSGVLDRNTSATTHAVRTSARETSNLDAYRAWTEGWLKIESLDVDALDAAVADFTRAIELDPGYALAHTGLASAKYGLYQTTRAENSPAVNLLNEAIAHARQAVALDPALAEAHAALSMGLVDSWKTPEAITAARRAVSLEPSHWRHLFRLAYASWGDTRLQAAADALALYPAFAFSHFQMAMVYVARSQLTQAETTLLQGLAAQSQQADGQTRFPALGLEWLRGSIRLAMGDVHGALECFDRELALVAPHRLYGREYAMAAHLGRGYALLRGGGADAAEAELRQALTLYPDHARVLVALSSALAAQGRSADADQTRAFATRATRVLDDSKPVEAAIVRAQACAAERQAGPATEKLLRMLATAPPGFAGWTIPIEPLFQQLQADQRFSEVTRRLAYRAR